MLSLLREDKRPLRMNRAVLNETQTVVVSVLRFSNALARGKEHSRVTQVQNELLCICGRLTPNLGRWTGVCSIA